MSFDFIQVEETTASSPGQRTIEIVERKGLGHPDTICDLVMEKISQALAKAYLERFGRILHHNCDKGLLAAGQAEHRLSGGRVTEPMRLVIANRSTPGCRRAGDPQTRSDNFACCRPRARDYRRRNRAHAGVLPGVGSRRACDLLNHIDMPTEEK